MCDMSPHCGLNAISALHTITVLSSVPKVLLVSLLQSLKRLYCQYHNIEPFYILLNQNKYDILDLFLLD